MKRILTGIQSTGVPHLGNLLGAIIPAITLADHGKQPAFFFIANLHSLTTQRDPQVTAYFTYATAAAWLACGLNTQRHILYRQSHVPEVCELAWYLNCVTPYPTLASAHAFKNKAKQLSKVTAGLFIYPILMSADILLYQATHVPVGKDQIQHLEIARDIAQAFNHQYGNKLTLPQAHITQEVAIISGTDGRKMSKSYHNTINVFANSEEITKTIMAIPTDSKPLASPKEPDNCLIFKLYQQLASPDQIAHMRTRYLQGGYGYYEAKKELITCLQTRFASHRKAFVSYMKDFNSLEKYLLRGEKKARAIAQDTLHEIRKAIGLHT